MAVRVQIDYQGVNHQRKSRITRTRLHSTVMAPEGYGLAPPGSSLETKMRVIVLSITVITEIFMSLICVIIFLYLWQHIIKQIIKSWNRGRVAKGSLLDLAILVISLILKLSLIDHTVW